jgi:predicted ATP-grasp superfamily ATP-dependent carboligase
VTLERVIDHAHPAIIVPCDDRAVWQLHELHEHRPDLRVLIEASIGDPGAYSMLRSRKAVMEAARDLGVRVPETRAIHVADDIQEWFRAFPGKALLKLDGTWGGSGVRLVASSPDAEKIWQKLVAPESTFTAWKQWIINRDPLAFWRSNFGAGPVTIQKFIPGANANAMLVAWQGELVGLASVEVLCTQGTTGASTIVRLFHSEEIVETARTLVEALGLSGFYGLDFILEEGSRRPFLIEVNPRCTQLGHLVLPGHGDLAGLLCAKLGARDRAALRDELPIDRELVAFFPQALAWNPESPYMQQCHHDVPWSEPALVRELLREPWPERQWLSRMYHWVRRSERHPLPSAGHFDRLAAQSGRVASVGKDLT